MVIGTLLLGTLHTPDEGLIDLDDAASAAERGKVARPHSFADAMGQEPRRLVGDFQNAVQLMGGNTLLAARHQIDGLHGLVEREAHVLEHGADLNGELLLAVATAPKAKPDALFGIGLHLRDPVHATAMRASATVRPDDAFQMLESLGFVVKFGAAENGY